jgi:hypothetical protein
MTYEPALVPQPLAILVFRSRMPLSAGKPPTAEGVGFPFAAQAARLLRQTDGRQDEEVALITSAPPKNLNALTWLLLNRQGLG